jgi:hypothetical protein
LRSTSEGTLAEYFSGLAIRSQGYSGFVAVIINPGSRFGAIDEEPYRSDEEQEEEEEVEWHDKEVVELYCYLFGKSVVCETVTREN